MPCYLFTYHGYGTWLPDRDEGFVRRHEGHLQPDRPLANIYRAQMTETVVLFDAKMQRAMLEESLVAAEKLYIRLHWGATETAHLHLLASWHDLPHWKRIRISLKSSLSRRFNRDLYRRTWLAEGGDATRVIDDVHFRHLVDTYLPSHRGWKWSSVLGWLEPERNHAPGNGEKTQDVIEDAGEA